MSDAIGKGLLLPIPNVLSCIDPSYAGAYSNRTDRQNLFDEILVADLKKFNLPLTALSLFRQGKIQQANHELLLTLTRHVNTPKIVISATAKKLASRALNMAPF
jgi:hypothetical protein